MHADTQERLLKDGYALIESNKRKRVLIASQSEAVANLNAIIDKDHETITSQQGKIDDLEAELKSVISGNPDLAMVLTNRDNEITELKAQAENLKKVAADTQAKLDAEIQEDNDEDAKIRALLEAEEAILDADNDAMVVPAPIDQAVAPGA